MSESTPVARPAPFHLMVVDDEKLIRWSISRHFEARGHQVTTAESGEEALHLLQSCRPDLLLLDLRLPGLDGLHVLRAARERYPELVVLMLSAHGSVDSAVAAMRQGAADFLTKPFELAALEVALQRNLDNSRMRRQLVALQAERNEVQQSHPLIGCSPAMLALRELCDKVARSNASTVLIEGPSGAGKEMVARYIHFQSQRADKPFLAVNCTSLPEPLVESELLGHEKGAFTDAKARKLGLFELADGGTVLLDEIGDMSLGTQAKILRLLDTKTFKRVGGTVDVQVDVRVIAVTHRHLRQLVDKGAFREDLFFRLNIVALVVPPLTQRVEDLWPLCAHFIARFNCEFGRQVQGIGPEALRLLQRYAWPGNVRELRNVIERAFILEASHELNVEHLPPEVVSAPTMAAAKQVDPAAGDLDLNRAQVQLISDALQRVAGNQSRAAKLLGITRDTLRYRMKKLGLGQ